MTNNKFLEKILDNNYGEMTFREYQLIDICNVVFRVNKKYHQIIEKVSNNPSTKFNDSVREELMEIIDDKVPLRIIVLGGLCDHPIVEKDCVIDFKNSFYKLLEKMNVNQLCHLIDYVGFFSRELKISFFGSNNNRPIAYHGLNEVISKSLGLSLVFEFFERNNKKEYFKIDINKINRRFLIERIKEYFKMYFYLLEGMCEVILEVDDEGLDKKNIYGKIRDKLGKLYSVVKDEHKFLSVKGRKNPDRWKYHLGDEDINLDDYEEDED